MDKELLNKLHALVLKGKVEEGKRFYWENLHKKVEKKFVDNVKKRINSKELQEYDWLIIPAGLEESYYVLLIKALKPKRVYFLCTQEFRNEFLDNVTQKTGLKREQYVVNVVQYKGMDVAEVYGKIKENISLFKGKVAVDLTRGKRIISAGAAIMASFFGFDLIYVDEDWWDDIKRGIPGTEELILVKNPFHIFGDLEKNYARLLFNQYNFDSSKIFFKELCSKVKDPREFEVAMLLSETYEHWDQFNYSAALIKLQEAIRKIEQFDIKIYSKEFLNKNLSTLRILNKINRIQKLDELLEDNELIINLLADLYKNAFRKREEHRIDDSIVRLYRLLELISQYRLAKYKITTSNPSYKELPELEEAYQSITQELYNQKRNLPFEIGIKDGHIILFLLKDEIWSLKTIEDLKKFLGPIRLRDNSIIAHGIETISEKAFQKIEKTCKEFLNTVCKIHNKELNKLLEQHDFIKM